MTRPWIDPAEIDRIMGRKPHRLQSPAHGWLQPTDAELRWTLAIIVAVVFACFAVLPFSPRDGGAAQQAAPGVSSPNQQERSNGNQA